MRLIDEKTLITINKKICNMYNQESKIINQSNLSSCFSVFDSYYETEEEIAAAFFRSIITSHSFQDANKRTACVALWYIKKGNLSAQELAEVTLEVANNTKLSVKEIADKIYKIEESYNPTYTYKYIGPVYRFERIYDNLKEPVYTEAKSKKHAANMIKGKLKKKYGFSYTAKLDIDEDKVEQVISDPEYFDILDKEKEIIEHDEDNYIGNISGYDIYFEDGYYIIDGMEDMKFVSDEEVKEYLEGLNNMQYNPDSIFNGIDDDKSLDDNLYLESNVNTYKSSYDKLIEHLNTIDMNSIDNNTKFYDLTSYFKSLFENLSYEDREDIKDVIDATKSMPNDKAAETIAAVLAAKDKKDESLEEEVVDLDDDFLEEASYEDYHSYNESFNRYSDVQPKEVRNRGWWYFTTHGVQPGSIPKDVNVLEVRDGKSKNGMNGTFMRLDAILNTSELRKYDIREEVPQSLKEDTVKQNGKWVNKGKKGTHGKFATKKAADAQRKAMFANCFKESLKEDYNNPSFSAFITNLGKYNEGELVGKWVDFPIDEEEFEKVLKEIKIGDSDEFGSPYEEWFVTDYECNLPGFSWEQLGEYPSYETLQEYGEKIESINNVEAVSNALEVTGDLDSAINGLENGNIIYMSGISSDSDLAYYWIDNVYGGIENVDKETLENYIDIEALGRDLSFEYYENNEGEELSAGEYWCGDEDASDLDIGQAYIDAVGIEEVSNLENYFDYDEFGRQLSFDDVTFTSDGCVQRIL